MISVIRYHWWWLLTHRKSIFYEFIYYKCYFSGCMCLFFDTVKLMSTGLDIESLIKENVPLYKNQTSIPLSWETIFLSSCASPFLPWSSLQKTRLDYLFYEMYLYHGDCLYLSIRLSYLKCKCSNLCNSWILIQHYFYYYWRYFSEYMFIHFFHLFS